MRFGPEGIECVLVARAGKPIGIGGGISLWWRVPFSAFEVSLGEGDFFFFELEGLLVPYRIEELAPRSDELSMLRVRGIGDVDSVKRLSGVSVYALASRLAAEAVELDGEQAFGLEGYTVLDQEGQTIGRIEEVLELSLNVVLRVVQPDGREVLLPFHQDLLLPAGVDDITRWVHMHVAAELLAV